MGTPAARWQLLDEEHGSVPNGDTDHVVDPTYDWIWLFTRAGKQASLDQACHAAFSTWAVDRISNLENVLALASLPQSLRIDSSGGQCERADTPAHGAQYFLERARRLPESTPSARREGARAQFQRT